MLDFLEQSQNNSEMLFKALKEREVFPNKKLQTDMIEFAELSPNRYKYNPDIWKLYSKNHILAMIFK